MKNKILFVLCVLFGLMFINGGLNKFFNYMPMPEEMPEEQIKMFTAMVTITWLMPLLATFELIGGILIIIPRFRALGAVILAPIMAGILLTHFTTAPEGLPIALVLLAIYVWVLIDNWKKYLPMIEK